jgi:cobalt-zinc-cadmium efflux system outer membrane protein
MMKYAIGITMKKILFWFLIIMGFFISSYAQLRENTLDSLVNLALQVSPKLKMLNYKYEAAKSRINVNSNLPDPMLTLGLANLPTNTFSFTQEPMTGKIIGLSQAVPFPGKLNTVGYVASKDADIVQQEIDDARNEIIKNVSQNYYELIYVRKAIDVANENLKLLNEISKVVRTNYSVAKASQQNLFKVELEITNLNDKINELKNKENSVVAMINAQLLRNQNSPVYTGDLPSIKYYEFTQQQLDSIAVHNRPFLTGINLAKQKAELMESLAKYDFYPNFNFSVQYSQRDRIAATNMPLADFASFMVGISLPLNYGGKVSSKVEESEAMQNMYDEQFNLSLQMLNGNFGTAISKLNSLKVRIKLTEDAQLPQAQKTFSSTLSGYQVGQVDFLNVIDAQSKLDQVETNLYRLKTDYLKEVEELKFLTGSRDLK